MRLENIDSKSNTKISQDLNELMLSVKAQMHRALEKAICSHFVHRIQSTIRIANGGQLCERLDTGAKWRCVVPKISISRNESLSIILSTLSHTKQIRTQERLIRQKFSVFNQKLTIINN